VHPRTVAAGFESTVNDYPTRSTPPSPSRSIHDHDDLNLNVNVADRNHRKAVVGKPASPGKLDAPLVGGWRRYGHGAT